MGREIKHSALGITIPNNRKKNTVSEGSPGKAVSQQASPGAAFQSAVEAEVTPATIPLVQLLVMLGLVLLTPELVILGTEEAGNADTAFSTYLCKFSWN